MAEASNWLSLPGYVYLTYDAEGQLLYVGSTIRVGRRLMEHEQNAAWWSQVARIEIEGPFESRDPAYVRERALIHERKPRYNIHPGTPGITVRHSGTPRPPRRLTAMDEQIIQLREAGKTRWEIMAETGLSYKGLQGRIKRLLAEGKIARKRGGNASKEAPL